MDLEIKTEQGHRKCEYIRRWRILRGKLKCASVAEEFTCLKKGKEIGTLQEILEEVEIQLIPTSFGSQLIQGIQHFIYTWMKQRAAFKTLERGNAG